MSRAIFAPLLLALSVLLGCAKSQPSSARTSDGTSDAESNPSAADASSSSPVEIRRIAADNLAVEAYMPPLDGGRVEVAPPQGWRPLPRDSKHLVRFYKDNRNALPRIEMLVEEGPIGGIADGTDENLPKLAAEVARELDDKGTAVLERPLPMVIGKMPCVRYVSNLRLKLRETTILAERQTLIVLHDGRRYIINVLVLPNLLSEGKDPAYAVCAALRFPEPEAVPVTPTAK